MNPFQIERIYLDEDSRCDGVSETVIRNLPHVPVETVRDRKSLIKRFQALPDPLGAGKRHLLVTRFYGKRLKPCPGTSRHICCGYHVINVVTNCPMDCSYCVLQEYLNNPFLTVTSNWEDLLQEIDDFLSTTPQSFPRLGTGELSDSLALDPILPVSETLVPFFGERGKGILELKTKSAEVDRLLGLSHRERTVVSWSLNPTRMIQAEEIQTAPLEERIEAARRCQEDGYLLGFHFDPMIHCKGWEQDYQDILPPLFRRIDPRRVVWISLGGFRYPPDLKPIATERFPKTGIFLGELFPGKDGKFRYLREIRVEMYRKMVGWLREAAPGLFIYLCMESQEVWEQVFGWSPRNNAHLNHLFAERLKEVLG